MVKSLKSKVSKFKQQNKWGKFFDTFISLSVILGFITGIIVAFNYIINENFPIFSNFIIVLTIVVMSVIFSYIIGIAILSVIALTLDILIPELKRLQNKIFHKSK